MPQICHAHCPPDGSSLLGFAAGGGVVVAAGGMAIGAVIDQLVITAAVVVCGLLIASTWYLVHILRRDRRHLTTREDAARLAEAVRKPLPGVRHAITGAYVITDVTEAPEPARIAIKRDGTVTG